MALFYEQGFHATGMAQILKQAEVNSGSLYHFFESKEALLLAVLDRYTELLHPVLLAPVFERVADPIERIFALLDLYRAGLVQTDFAAGCPIGNLALELREFHPRAREKVEANFEGWRRAVRQCLEEAAARFPPGTDLDRLATLTLAVMEGAVMQCRAARSIEPFDASVGALRDYVERLRAGSQKEE